MNNHSIFHRVRLSRLSTSSTSRCPRNFISHRLYQSVCSHLRLSNFQGCPDNLRLKLLILLKKGLRLSRLSKPLGQPSNRLILFNKLRLSRLSLYIYKGRDFYLDEISPLQFSKTSRDEKHKNGGRKMKHGHCSKGKPTKT